MSVNYEVVKGPNYEHYANPGFGAQLGQMLQGLPDSYMQGRQMAQQRQMEDMFKTEKLPRNQDGSVDVNNLIERGTKIGGFPFVMKMLPFLQSQEIMNRSDKNQVPTISGGDQGQGPGTVYMPGPGMKGATSNNPPGQQTRTSSSGSDTGSGPGEDTLRSVATEFVGGDNDASPQISAAARALRLDPDAPLTQDKVKLVKDFLGTARGATSSLGNQETQPPGQPSSAAERNGNGPGGANAAPFMAGGASGAPSPAAGGGRPPQPAQAQLGQPPGPPQRFAQATGQGTGLPPGWTERAAGNYEKYARTMSNYASAAQAAGNENLAKGFMEKSTQAAQTAKMIREKIAENAALTPEAKKARESGIPGGPLGMETAAETRKKDIDISKTKTEPKIRAMADIAHESQPQIDIMRRTVSDPNFYSGAGDELMKKWNQWSVALGKEPDLAKPMETFNKNAMRVLNDQIGAMTSAGYSRIQLQEIKNLKESIANLKITPASNRYLIEELSRVHDQNIKLSKLAQDYIENNGYLGPGWEKVKDQFFEDPKNKLFSKEELDDPRLISPPYLPQGIASNADKKAQWARNQGLKAGDPFMVDGPDPRKPAGPDNVRHIRAW